MPGTTYVEQLNIVEPLETDGGSGESLVRSPDGKIRKGTGGGGGSQNLQQTLDNGSEGTVDTDIIITHGSGANTAMLGLTDGYVSASAGDNQFGLNEQEGSFTSQLRIFERLILMSGGSSGEVAFSGTEMNFIIDGIVRGSINAEGRLTIVNEDGFSGRFAPDNLTGSRTFALPDEDGTLALRESNPSLATAILSIFNGNTNWTLEDQDDLQFKANGNVRMFFTPSGAFGLINPSNHVASISNYNNTQSNTYDLPDASGTLALEENVVPYTGANNNLDMGDYEIKAFTYRDYNGNYIIDEAGLVRSIESLKIRNSSTGSDAQLTTSLLTVNRDYQFPDKNGTFAMVSDIDNAIAGLTFKTSVKAATTANIAIASAPASVDGVTLTNGDRVLLKNQTDATQNGIYIFNGTGSNLTRSTDADTGSELANKTIPVDQGTANADSWWTVTNDSITLGTTNITLSKTAGQGLYNAGTGIDITGSTISISSAYTSARDAYADGRVAQTITNGVTTSAPSQDAVFDALALKQDISTLSEAIRTSMFAVSSTTNTGFMNPALGLADNLKRLENRINLLGTSTSQKTASYGITASDFFVELTANTATFTLPTAVGAAGKQYIVKNSGTGVLTLATSSSQTIDGMATKNINTQYMGYRVISDGANWKIIGAF